MVNLDGVTLQRSKFSFPRGRRNKGVEAAQGGEMDTDFTLLWSVDDNVEDEAWGGEWVREMGYSQGTTLPQVRQKVEVPV